VFIIASGSLFFFSMPVIERMLKEGKARSELFNEEKTESAKDKSRELEMNSTHKCSSIEN
jgi:hypothetical protein